MNRSERNERTFDAVLAVALEDYWDRELEAVKAEIAALPSVLGSAEHTRKMRKLVRRAAHEPGWAVRGLRRAALLILILSAIMLAAALSVREVREVVWATLVAGKEGRPIGLRGSPMPTPNGFILPPYVPAGFAEALREEIMGGATIVYRDAAQQEIVFHQYPLESDVRHRVEGTRLYSQREHNDITLHVYEAAAGEKNILEWLYLGMRYRLESTLASAELWSIADGILEEISKL